MSNAGAEPRDAEPQEGEERGRERADRELEATEVTEENEIRRRHELLRPHLNDDGEHERHQGRSLLPPWRRGGATHHRDQSGEPSRGEAREDLSYPTVLSFPRRGYMI